MRTHDNIFYRFKMHAFLTLLQEPCGVTWPVMNQCGQNDEEPSKFYSRYNFHHKIIYQSTLIFWSNFCLFANTILSLLCAYILLDLRPTPPESAYSAILRCTTSLLGQMWSLPCVVISCFCRHKSSVATTCYILHQWARSHPFQSETHSTSFFLCFSQQPISSSEEGDTTLPVTQLLTMLVRASAVQWGGAVWVDGDSPDNSNVVIEHSLRSMNLTDVIRRQDDGSDSVDLSSLWVEISCTFLKACIVRTCLWLMERKMAFESDVVLQNVLVHISLGKNYWEEEKDSMII